MSHMYPTVTAHRRLSTNAENPLHRNRGFSSRAAGRDFREPSLSIDVRRAQSSCAFDLPVEPQESRQEQAEQDSDADRLSDRPQELGGAPQLHRLVSASCSVVAARAAFSAADLVEKWIGIGWNDREHISSGDSDAERVADRFGRHGPADAFIEQPIQ